MLKSLNVNISPIFGINRIIDVFNQQATPVCDGRGLCGAHWPVHTNGDCQVITKYCIMGGGESGSRNALTFLFGEPITSKVLF